MSGIIIYSHPDCPPCDRAKDYFRERDIDFDEKSIQEALKNNGDGITAVPLPLITIGGDTIKGFKKKEIEKGLKEKEIGGI